MLRYGTLGNLVVFIQFYINKLNKKERKDYQGVLGEICTLGSITDSSLRLYDFSPFFSKVKVLVSPR